MSEESKKFPAVMTLVELFGLEKGTVLRFDWASGKYVSIEENEDIAEDYYYSGFAVALDPYLVKDNVGTYFTFIEQEDDAEPEPEQPKPAPEPEPVKEEVEEVPQKPEYTKKHAFVIDCECGHRHLVDVIQAAGVSTTIMADDESTAITLSCEECGSKLKLWFAPDEIEDEPTEEKSN